MILLININNFAFHYYEFVKPIEDILRKQNIKFESYHYKKINKDNVYEFDKIIICGTSLKDNGFLDDIKEFNFIKKIDNPVLGICGGMHILSMIYNGRVKKCQEIGLNRIKLKREIFKLKDEVEVYSLHNFYAESDEFEILANSKKCPQITKHKKKPFYGVLFHPEVRNKNMIINFCQKK